MKKFSTLLAIVICTFISAQSFAQEAFMEYSVNGVAYKANADQFIAYQTFSDDYNVEGKKAAKSVSASVSGIYGLLYTIDIQVNIDTSKNFEPDSFSLGESTLFLKKVPCGYVKAVKRIGKEEKLEFYETEAKAKGKIVITKVDDNWIEGTFEAELIPQYPIKIKTPLKITKGKFRFEANMQE
jgi:hypothetical protein